MSWTYVAHRGTNNSKGAGGTSISVSPTANIGVGAVLLVRCVTNNITTSSGNSSDHTACSDNSTQSGAANVYTKLCETTRSSGAAADGCTQSLWVTIVTRQIQTTDSVTVSHGSLAARVIGLEEFSIAAGNTVVRAGFQGATGGTASPTVTISSLPNVTHLFIAHIAIEGPNGDGYTPDSDYSNNTSIGTTGGSADTNVGSRFGTRIVAATTDTHAPTLGTARDNIDMLMVLDEVLLTTSDSATEAETASGSATSTDSDTQTEAEAVPGIALALSESPVATLAETTDLQQSAPGVTKTDSDSATDAETGSLSVAIGTSDTGATGESGSTAATPSTTDTLSETERELGAATLTSTDSDTFTESTQVVAQSTTPTDADTAVCADTATLSQANVGPATVRAPDSAGGGPIGRFLAPIREVKEKLFVPDWPYVDTDIAVCVELGVIEVEDRRPVPVVRRRVRRKKIAVPVPWEVSGSTVAVADDPAEARDEETLLAALLVHF